jgi:HlyD family secretion protein
MDDSVKSKFDADLKAALGLDRPAGRIAVGRRALKWGAAIAAVLALAGIMLLFAGRPAAVLSYVTLPTAKGNLTETVTATGTVQPINKVDVSSELSGTTRRVLVDYNSAVKVGQILAELDTDKLKATVESSRARLVASKAHVAEAAATVEEKRSDYERKRSLAEKQFTSGQDLGAAKAAYERAVAVLASARADVGVAEAELRLNETNLEKAYIRSPIDGVVLKRNVDPGQTVASSLQAPVLFSIAEDLRKMELQVDVDEADVGKVKEGQIATFSVDAYPDRRFPATIRVLRYAPETVQGVVTYKAVLNVDNTELLVRPGMTATADITVKEVTDAMLAPNAALRFTPPASQANARPSVLKRFLPGVPQFRPPSQKQEAGPNRTLWVLRDGKPAAVSVVVGASDGKMTEIVKGDIAPPQAVIVDSVARR